MMDGNPELAERDDDVVMLDAPDEAALEAVHRRGIQRGIQIEFNSSINPAEYHTIPRNNVVEKVLGNVEEINGTFYTVWLTSGHTDQVDRGQLEQMSEGTKAYNEWLRESRLNAGKMSQSRTFSESEDIPEGDYEPPGRHTKRARHSESSEVSDATTRQQRHSTREASRRATQRIDEMATESKRYGADKFAAKTQHRQLRPRHAQDESDDELAQDPEYALPNIRSDIGGASRTFRSRRAKKQPYSGSHVDADSDIEFEPTRRSQRATKSTKNMRDVDIDAGYESVERVMTTPKYIGVRETFRELPKDSEFRRWHSQICTSCDTGADSSKGPLVFCQGCSYSYHQACLKSRSQRDHRVTKIGADAFVLQCKFCVLAHRWHDWQAPDRSLCQDCKTPGSSCAEFSTKKTSAMEESIRSRNGGEDPVTAVQPDLIDNPENVLFRCTTCSRAYHFEHLPALSMYPVRRVDTREQNLEDYSRDDVEWHCKECISTTNKIHAIVAWRPIDPNTTKYNYQMTEDDKEYLIKWQDKSHFHDTWMPGAWVYGIAAAQMRNSFHQRKEEPKLDEKSAIEADWLLADIILDVVYHDFTPTSKADDLKAIPNIVRIRVKFRGLGYEEVVWDQPPPRNSGAPWKTFRSAYSNYLDGKYFPPMDDQRMRNRVSQYRSLDFKRDCELKSQPSGLESGHDLMEYQMEGVNWLLLNYHQQQNAILADEMGLGKTIQIVSLIDSLVEDKPRCWPFLVVVPNATCPNWRRELKSWAPGLRVVAYHGGKVSQELAYKYELFPDGVRNGMKAHVVIMSYEAATAVKSEFNSINWAGLIVDEGQRLKNEDTQLYQRLKDFRIPFKVLLTGTPLQNNKRELFNLLQFVDPNNNAEELDKKYEELTKDNLPELHNLIRPYFLRRTKLEVLKFLPPMSHVILPVTMTVLQEKLCKSIIAKNPDLIKAILSNGRIRTGERKSLKNIMSDLRQCLCHPFCFNPNIEDENVSYAQKNRNFIEASPKLVLMEIMLPKLKERGHRVLIFSQFLRCLDVLEDFLTLLGLQYGRVDGKMSALKKQKQIDAFNAEGSPLFAMLLSTRAGGVGINLASADTVIIYDPDWNPHQDLQAISRAHRIGQKEKVLCFQLTTKDTVEENMLQAGKKKLALDQALIERLDADEESNGDLESLLLRGAEALFTDKEKTKIVYDEGSVEKLIDRSQIEAQNNNNGGIDGQFRVWSNDSGSITDGMNIDDDDAAVTDPGVWENILRLREEKHQAELAATQVEYGRGARRRGKQAIDYSKSRVSFIEGVNDIDEDSSDVQPEPDNADSDDDDDEEYRGDNMEVDVEEQTPAPVAEPTKQPTTIAKRGRKPGQSAAPAPEVVVNGSVGLTQIHPPRHPLDTNPRPLYHDVHPTFPQNSFQNPLSKSMPSRSMNPNLIDSIPRRQPNTVADKRLSSPNFPPVLNPVTTRTIPTGAQIATPMNGGHGNVTLSGGMASPAGGDGVCLICKGRHLPNHSCVNFGSEISLRLAIDSLRTCPNQPNIQAYRDLLLRQLRQLTGR